MLGSAIRPSLFARALDVFVAAVVDGELAGFVGAAQGGYEAVGNAQAVFFEQRRGGVSFVADVDAATGGDAAEDFVAERVGFAGDQHGDVDVGHLPEFFLDEAIVGVYYVVERKEHTA